MSSAGAKVSGILKLDSDHLSIFLTAEPELRNFFGKIVLIR